MVSGFLRLSKRDMRVKYVVYICFTPKFAKLSSQCKSLCLSKKDMLVKYVVYTCFTPKLAKLS